MANEDLSKLRIDKSGTAYKARRSINKPIVWAALIAACIILGVLYKTVLNPSIEVEVTTVSRTYPSQSFTLLNASGYVVAQRKAAVASKATGRLEWLGVEEGSLVKKGQVIARLEGKDVAAAREQASANLSNVRSGLEQAKAELDDATQNYNRMKALVDRGFVAQMEHDTAEARYKKAKAAVTGAESAISASLAALNAADVAVEYTLIRAPFDAAVLTKNADIGDIVTPLGAAANAKAAVVTIADMSSLQVEVDVSESNLEKVKVKQPCEIQLDALPESRSAGVVHMIAPTADRSKASVMVKIRFLDRDTRVLPEMSAKVAFLERPVSREEQAPKTAVNPGAVVAKNGNQIVFLVHKGHVSEVSVKTGTQMSELLEIREGVKPGDKVVIRPPKKLKDGSAITIKEQ